jgi:hypothetical protein
MHIDGSIAALLRNPSAHNAGDAQGPVATPWALTRRSGSGQDGLVLAVAGGTGSKHYRTGRSLILGHMAAFDPDADLEDEKDWRLLANGFVHLYWRPSLLSEMCQWLVKKCRLGTSACA